MKKTSKTGFAIARLLMILSFGAIAIVATKEFAPHIAVSAANAEIAESNATMNQTIAANANNPDERVQAAITAATPIKPLTPADIAGEK